MTLLSLRDHRIEYPSSLKRGFDLSNEQIVAWVFEGFAGIVLLAMGAILRSIHADKKTLWHEHGRLRDDHSGLLRDYVALQCSCEE